MTRYSGNRQVFAVLGCDPIDTRIPWRLVGCFVDDYVRCSEWMVRVDDPCITAQAIEFEKRLFMNTVSLNKER